MGMITLDRTFEAVTSHLPSALVTPDALNRMSSLTRQLPASLTRFAYIECRLAADYPQVDLIFDINDEGKRIIAGLNPVIQLPDCIVQHPAWQRIRAFCHAWMNPRLPLLNAIRSIWLEFDLDQASVDVPVPGIFVRFEGGGQDTNVSEAEKHRILRDVVLPLLLGSPDAAMADRMHRCFENLPVGAQLTEAGVMLQRSTNSARLCFRRLPEEQLAGYLESIGWNGDTSLLERTLKRFSRSAPPGRERPIRLGYVDIDIGSTVQGTIGLEYFMDTGWQQLVHGLPEKEWLDQLVTDGLCDHDKLSALLTWPGYAHAHFGHELWPSIVVRHLNHIKLVFAPGHPLSAKAYLYFFHRYYKSPSNGNGSVWKRTSTATSVNEPLLL